MTAKNVAAVTAPRMSQLSPFLHGYRCPPARMEPQSPLARVWPLSPLQNVSAVAASSLLYRCHRCKTNTAAAATVPRMWPLSSLQDQVPASLLLRLSPLQECYCCHRFNNVIACYCMFAPLMIFHAIQFDSIKGNGERTFMVNDHFGFLCNLAACKPERCLPVGGRCLN